MKEHVKTSDEILGFESLEPLLLGIYHIGYIDTPFSQDLVAFMSQPY